MNNYFEGCASVIEIGGGDRPVFRPNLDMRRLPTVDIVGDLNAEWPVASSGYDGAYSSYVLEHLSWRKVGHFAKELFRILREGGRALLVTANLQEQARAIARKETLEENDVTMVFGDQNYADDWRANAHACGFSPSIVQKVFGEAGFRDILTYPHPNCRTDMIVELKKRSTSVVLSTTEERKRAFDQGYFDGGRGGYGGYAHEGYRDFPRHWRIFREVLGRKPASVLELGCARGYVLKRIQDAGIPATGLEISDHCLKTAATTGILQADIADPPWPAEDGKYDLCLTVDVLEHIPEAKIDGVIAEIRRTCRRSLNIVNFGLQDDGFDKTHCLLRDKAWWRERFGNDPAHEILGEHEVGEARTEDLPTPDGRVKLNCGSFMTMFHHGWLNIDKVDLGGWAANNGYRFACADLEKGIQCKESKVDAIYASHFLEHLDTEAGLKFLRECRRALKPEAVIRISCPDTRLLLDRFDRQELSEYDAINDGCAKAGTQLGKLSALLLPGHKVLYDGDTLVGALREAGLRDPRVMPFRQSQDPRIQVETHDVLPCLSVYVEARK